MKKVRSGIIAMALAGALALSGAGLPTSAYSPELKGAIGAKYKSMDGPSSQLRSPLLPEFKVPGSAQQSFQFGIIFWSRIGRAHPLWGPIEAKWYPGHEAGWPIRDEEPLGGGAIAQQFEDGIIYWPNGRTWAELYSDCPGRHGIVSDSCPQSVTL